MTSKFYAFMSQSNALFKITGKQLSLIIHHYDSRGGEKSFTVAGKIRYILVWQGKVQLLTTHLTHVLMHYLECSVCFLHTAGRHNLSLQSTLHVASILESADLSQCRASRLRNGLPSEVHLETYCTWQLTRVPASPVVTALRLPTGLTPTQSKLKSSIFVTRKQHFKPIPPLYWYFKNIKMSYV